jgi:hypothetical protein
LGWHTGLWEPDGYWDRALVIKPPGLPAVLTPDLTEQEVFLLSGTLYIRFALAYEAVNFNWQKKLAHLIECRGGNILLLYLYGPLTPPLLYPFSITI